MEKRLTLALVLCAIFVFGYTLLVRSLSPPPPPEPPPAESGGTASVDGPREAQPKEAAAGEPASRGPEGAPEGGTPGGDGEPASPEAEFPVETASTEATLRVETDRYIVEFTNRGAAPFRILLKGVTRESGEDPSVEENLLPILEANEPGVLPLVWRHPESGRDLGDLLWKVLPPTREGEESIQSFEVVPGDGTRVRKSFRFADGRDHIDVTVEVFTESSSVANRKQRFSMEGAAGIVFEGYPGQDDLTYSITKFSGRRDLLVVRPRDLRGEEPKTVAGDAEFAAVVSKYFAAILKPVAIPGQVLEVQVDRILDPRLRDVLLESGKLTIEDATSRAKQKLGVRMDFFDPLSAAGQNPLRYEFLVYLGFKDPAAFGKEPYRQFLPILDVTDASTCGMGFIVRPIASILLLALKGLYTVLGNFGFAIIVLTLLVKVFMFPLTKRQQVSMAKYQEKMQKYKPELDKIREKYKNNKQKMQQETMKFMKEHGVNPIPLGGCLPLFVTMPIFLGLFFVLRTAPELRQADFILWIHDLSRPDRLIGPDRFHFQLPCVPISGLNILPILMTAAWFLQQRMMPKPQDPQQRQTQQMMLFMPIMFGFMLYNFAAGLSLYWLTNSVLGIVEQKIIRKALHLGPAGVQPAPARPGK